MSNRLAEKALQDSRSFGVRRIPLLRPVGWLARGWSDFLACPLPGLVHGLLLALFGAGLAWLSRAHFFLMAGAVSAFLLVAPILVTGLYAVSRSLARGEPATLGTAVAAWKPNDTRLVVFGVLLALAGLGWVMTSASLIVGWSAQPVRTPLDFIRHVVLAPHGMLFEYWLGLGALLAAPVFASTVVAIPLLVDRQIGVMGAVFTSWRVVLEHPAPMALWAALILGLTLVGMATLMAGLVVVVPWLAHASWHAYRDTVDTAGLAQRS
ncbi:DUF2189 domain-containing protein [Ideonella livida]|uniref:DUF2189 domain-containing protein n=1 Tax=Ideonella livida TaxID=2707176 RepID=A0A7C9TJR7_9BURK|nr:DUF2189 domain-containing protein [Ideonella livida]NDY92220.1 DUF2189 domain-containing protein [Ideonella livida]